MGSGMCDCVIDVCSSFGTSIWRRSCWQWELIRAGTSGGANDGIRTGGASGSNVRGTAGGRGGGRG